MSIFPTAAATTAAPNNDRSYIVGPIGTPGLQVTIRKPGDHTEPRIASRDGTVHIRDKTYEVERDQAFQRPLHMRRTQSGEGGRLKRPPRPLSIPGAGAFLQENVRKNRESITRQSKTNNQCVESPMKPFGSNRIIKTARLNVRCNYSLVRHYVISMALLYRCFQNLTGEQINSL